MNKLINIFIIIIIILIIIIIIITIIIIIITFNEFVSSLDHQILMIQLELLWHHLELPLIRFMF
jgi:hypothetical protein